MVAREGVQAIVMGWRSLVVHFNFNDNYELDFINPIEEFNNEIVAFDQYIIGEIRGLRIIGATSINEKGGYFDITPLTFHHISNNCKIGNPVLVVNSRPVKFTFCELSDMRNNLNIFTNLIENEKKNWRLIPRLMFKSYFACFDDELSPGSLFYLPTNLNLHDYSGMISFVDEKGPNCMIKSLSFTSVPQKAQEFFDCINNNFSKAHTVDFNINFMSDEELRSLKLGFRVCRNLRWIRWIICIRKNNLQLRTSDYYEVKKVLEPNVIDFT
jgi:hypothetical protein